LIKGTKLLAIIDSGATYSFLSTQFCQSHAIPISKSSHSVSLANASKIDSVGSATVEIASGTKVFTHEFLVMDLLDQIDCFIGLDLFKQLDISFGTLTKSQYFLSAPSNPAIDPIEI
jgi:hypothetical protein